MRCGERPHQPTLLLVPGGYASGEAYFGITAISARYAGFGYTVVDFDPDGRGRSGGSEDWNGPLQQEGLASIIAESLRLPSVDPERLAVVAFSLGSTLAIGALSRHHELKVRLLVDWEGPLWKQQMMAVAPPGELPPQASSEAWWFQREAGNLITQLRAPYLRVQCQPGHGSKNTDDGSEAINRLRDSGGSPWARLNGDRPNRSYESGARPHLLPRIAAEVAVFPYLAELIPPPPRDG